jgi:hypothetical protein
MSDTDNWVTIQITSVLMIIFFAMIAIGYILFMYTNVLNKQNGNLLESAHFKSPMLFLTFFSSIIIIAIVSNSSKISSDVIYAIITIIVGLNVIIFGKTFEKIYKNMKQNEEKNKLRKAIKHISNKNSNLILEFKNTYPDCVKSYSKKSDQYNKLIIEAMGGIGDNVVEKEDKIIKKITKEVTIYK